MDWGATRSKGYGNDVNIQRKTKETANQETYDRTIQSTSNQPAINQQANKPTN